MNHPTIPAGQWRFGINDRSFIAWLILVAYFMTAILCWRARASALRIEPGTRTLWTVLSFCLILLSLNKQLDLHRLFMDVGLDLVAERDWQDYSPVLLGGIIARAGVLGVSVLLLGVKFLRGSNRELRWAYGTFFGLLAVQVVRFLPGTISGLLVTHVFAEEDGLFHVHAIELLELGSLTVVGLLARASACRNEAYPDDRHDDQRSFDVEESS